MLECARARAIARTLASLLLSSFSHRISHFAYDVANETTENVEILLRNKQRLIYAHTNSLYNLREGIICERDRARVWGGSAGGVRTTE